MHETELETNRRAWDVRTREHVVSRFYDVEGFLAGKSSLNAIERDEIGDVAGLRLLHLQCHFGLDTLSLARLGAHATGVDFSPEAIAQARDLGRRTQLAAEFALCDVYAAPETVGGGFNRVFTSYGAIEWLPDIGRWARVVADACVPAGASTWSNSTPAAMRCRAIPTSIRRPRCASRSAATPKTPPPSCRCTCGRTRSAMSSTP